MIPIKEKGWITLLGRAAEGIANLQAFRGTDGALYSLWRPSWAERFKILIGQPVAVGVLSRQQPPITVVVGRERIPGVVSGDAHRCFNFSCKTCMPHSVHTLRGDREADFCRACGARKPPIDGEGT